MKRIHIIGSGPRTGTTLLYELMVSCFDIDVKYHHELHVDANPMERCKVFITKHPSDYLAVEPVMKTNKKLFVICIIRDPRNTIISKHKKNKSIFWCGLRYWVYFYKFYSRNKNNKSILFIKYEDLTNNPNEIQDKIIQKIPYLKKIHNFTNFQNVAEPNSDSVMALNGLREIHKVDLDKWKKHKERIKQQIKIHGDITKSLMDLNYEKNQNWSDCLKEVNDLSFESHWPEFFSKFDMFQRRLIGYKAILKHLLFELFGTDLKNIKIRIKKLFK